MVSGIRPRRLASEFRRMARSLAQTDDVMSDQAGRVSLGELLHLHGQQSLSVMLMVMSLCCMLPLAGVGSVLGLLMLALARRWHLQDQSFELPQRLVQLRLTPRWSQRSLLALTWLYATASNLLRERLTLLSEQRFAGLWGLWIATMAIIIFLPVPLGNLVCGGSLVLLSLGWMFRDGVVLLLSALLGSSGIGLTVGLGWVGIRAVYAGSDWLARLF